MSQLLLVEFGPNFKGRLLGPSSTNGSCHGHICPGNIYVLTSYVQITNISAVDDHIFTKKFWPNFLEALSFVDKFFSECFRAHNFVWNQKTFQTQNFVGPLYFYRPNICLGLGDFHWRRGIKPFQAEQYRLKSCSFWCLEGRVSFNIQMKNDMNDVFLQYPLLPNIISKLLPIITFCNTKCYYIPSHMFLWDSVVWWKLNKVFKLTMSLRVFNHK